MRKNRGLAVLVTVGLALVALGLRGGQESGASERVRAFGGALPLWEPEWSPTLLLPGATMYPAVDRPDAFAAADIDGDGIQDLLVGGDYVHVYSIVNGELHKRYLTILVGPLKFVGPGRERLNVMAMATGDIDGDGRTDLVVATKDGKLWVLGNHGPWGFQWRPGSPYGIFAGQLWLWDYTGDGALDVLCASGYRLFFLPGDGQEGRLGEAVELSGPTGRIGPGGFGAYRGRPGFFVLAEDGVWFFASCLPITAPRRTLSTGPAQLHSNHSYLEFLEALVDGEIAARESKALMKRIKAARFPVVKTLEEFDFKFQPKLDVKLIKTLATCQFI